MTTPRNSPNPPSMTVVTQSTLGGPEVLRLAEIPQPSPLPTEVLVRVHAAGVNPVDWKTRSGGGVAGVLGAPPFVLGWDVAGVVEAVGFGVTTLRPGDRVFGMPWFPRAAGAYAEFVTAPARQLALVPAGISMEEAASVPLAALTAWQSLVDTAGVRPGDKVVVTAAAGGVGHFAVQLARHLGATVVAVASLRHHAWLAAHGADQLVDYMDVRFEEEIADADVVLELVGDDQDRTTTRAVRTLRPGGLLVAVPGGASKDVTSAARRAGIRVTPFMVEPDGPALGRIADLLATGEVVVEVAQVFPLSEASASHTVGESGRTRGKLVLRVVAQD